MSDETSSPAGVESIALPADAPETFDSPTSAAKYLADLWDKRDNPLAESADKATADDPELSKDNSDPETAPAEDAEANEPDDKSPPIDPPRSWTQAEKERFQSLPRETQEYLSHREQERETALRRSQNEIAEQRKAIEAKLSEADRVRQQYEAKISSTVKIMEDALQAEFGDIQTMQDVRKLQAEDPFRFQAWQVRQMELTAAKSEQVAAEQRQSLEKQGKRTEYETEQNKTLVELVPEMADPKKASELRERAVKMLTDDLGLKTEQLSRWMADDTGHEILSNAGIQKLIADGLKYQDIKAAPKVVAPKTLPPVQRPGTARAPGAANAENIKALEAKLNNSGSEKDAWRLYEARLNSRRAS